MGCSLNIDRHAQLNAIHFYGMAAAWNEWRTESSKQQKPVKLEVWRERLITAEQSDRQACNMTRHNMVTGYVFSCSRMNPYFIRLLSQRKLRAFFNIVGSTRNRINSV